MSTAISSQAPKKQMLSYGNFFENLLLLIPPKRSKVSFFFAYTLERLTVCLLIHKTSGS